MNLEDEGKYECPNCGSTRVRHFFDADVDNCGDVEGCECEDCGYEGTEEEFLTEYEEEI